MNNGHKISAPIGLAEVYNILGLAAKDGRMDLAWLCHNSHGMINKWSKIKPVRRDTPLALSKDDYYVGSNQDYFDGVFYGLRVAGLFGKIIDLHNCTFDYFPPEEGDWCRLTDFDGYDHTAKPNPYGEVPPEVDTRFDMFVRVEYADRSLLPPEWAERITGVDLDDIISNGDANVNATMAGAYPCVLISEADAPQTGYARVLVPWNDEGMVPRRMCENGEWEYRWRAPMADGCPKMIKEKSDKIVTVFFVTTYKQAGIFDLGDWSAVDSTTLVSVRGFACPMAVRVPSFIREYQEPWFKAIAMATPAGATVSAIWTGEWEVGMRAIVTIKVRIGIGVGSGGSIALEGTYTEPPLPLAGVISWGSMGGLQVDWQNTQVSATVTNVRILNNEDE